MAYVPVWNAAKRVFEYVAGLQVRRIVHFPWFEKILERPSAGPASSWSGRAFGLVHHVQPDQFPALLNRVRQGRQEVGYFHFVREVDGQSLNTILSPTWRLSGRDVRLLSNDIELIATLSAQGFHPPPPWITLYEFGPVLHISQGDLHFWLNHVWDPFWESLGLDEQTGFLQEGKKETAAYIPDEDWKLWVESIRMRDARFRELGDRI